MIEYAGATVRKSDIFGQSKNALAMTKRFIKGLKVNFVIYVLMHPAMSIQGRRQKYSLTGFLMPCCGEGDFIITDSSVFDDR